MKKLSLKELFGLSVFFVLILVSVLVIHPVYRQTASVLDRYIQSFCRQLETSYGISVSYSSLSPSVFSGIHIKGIEIRDASGENRILEIRRTVLRYSFFRLLSGDVKGALKDLTVDGVVLDVTEETEAFFAEKRRKTEKTPLENGGEGSEESGGKASVIDFEKIISSVPFDVFIKNVHVQYSAGRQIADIFLKRLTLSLSQETHSLLVKTSGSALLSNDDTRRTLSASFSLDGSLAEEFDGSLLNIRFSDLTDGNYRFNRLNLRVSYDDRVMEIRTIQNAYPFFIIGSYNFDTADARLEVKTQNLNPGNVFSVKRDTALMKKLRALSVGIQAAAEYNLRTGEVRYSSGGEVSVSKQLVDGGLAVSFYVEGDSDKFSVRSLEAEGKALNASLSGDFSIKNRSFSGAAQIYNYTLSNGGVISTELYFDPLENGFVCFAPQLLLDEKAFTALQLTVLPVNDSVDFAFELSDYSHYDTAEPASVKIDGSFITDTKYLQANMTVNGMYLDSVAQAASFFGKNRSKSAFAFLSPFAFNSEAYFSSDLKTFSYNVPYIVVANTKKDNQFVYLSLDGNDSSVQVSQLNVISGGQMAQFSGLIEKIPETQEAFALLEAQFGSIPYHFSGSIRKNSVSISGDYGVAFDMHTSGRERYDGAFSMDEFPVAFPKAILALSVDTGFSYTKEDGLNLMISRIFAQEAGGKYAFSPQLAVSAATISKYGAFLNQIEYKDSYSSLKGKSQLLWSVNDGIFDSASFLLEANDKTGTESVSISVDVSNPMRDSFSGDFVKHSMYVNSQAVLKNFDLNRFTSEVNEKNALTATVIATGTIDNPYIGINVDSLGFTKGGKSVSAAGSAYVEEKMLAMENAHLYYNKLSFTGISAAFDLSTFSGKASAVLDTVVMKKTVHAPLELSVSETYVAPGTFVPAEFAATLQCKEVTGSFIKKPFPFELTVLHSAETTAVFTSEQIGISGVAAHNGDIQFTIADGKPVFFRLDGSVSSGALSLSLDDVRADIGELYSYIDVPKLKVYKGVLKGAAKIGGVSKDPDFTGKFVIDGVDFSLPTIIPSHITVPRIQAVMNHTQLDVPEIKALVKNNYPVFGSAVVYLDRWSFDRLEAKVRTPEKGFVPADFNIRLAEIEGDASVNLDIVYADHYLDVSGDILVKNTNARAKTKQIATTSAPSNRSFYVRSDLNITLLQHCIFRFDPLLRAVFTPNSQFKFKYDMEESIVQIDGEIALRSGDIAYLSRNFYLKNGVMRFNKNDTTFNPLVTLTAETREKDENGNDVRLILSAVNQYLFDLNPQISSIPAKSETEISQMLGQIAVGDSDNISGFLLATGDYAIQSTVGRNIENKLRDFFNFDILSIRTSVLQNALKFSLSSSKSDSGKNSQEIGNYLDNSTVYIGKYFGSALYADALLHWSYDETRVDDRTTAGGLVFQPEIGLEMESPLANIRWNMAPDIDALMNSRLVGSTSVTLSWKFSF